MELANSTRKILEVKSNSEVAPPRVIPKETRTPKQTVVSHKVPENKPKIEELPKKAPFHEVEESQSSHTQKDEPTPSNEVHFHAVPQRKEVDHHHAPVIYKPQEVLHHEQ